MYVYQAIPLETYIASVYQNTRQIFHLDCLHYDRVVAKVDERYTALTQKYSSLQNAHNKTIEKLRAAKAHIKTWETWYERCKARERAKNTEQHGAERERRNDPDTRAREVEPIAHDGPRRDAQLNTSVIPSVSPRLLPGPARSVISPKQGLATPTEARSNRSYPAATNDVLEQGQGSARDQDRSEFAVHHDDETDGREHGADKLPTSKPGGGLQATASKPIRPDISGYSSDQPVLVSERSLKKRKRQPNIHTPSVSINEDVQKVGSVTKPIHVKSENNSSSPAPAGRGELVMQDSLDLDDVGTRLITPRKRRRLQELLRLSQTNPLAAGAGVRVGQAPRNNQPLEGPMELGLVIKDNMAAKPGETNRSHRSSLSQGTKQRSGIVMSTGPWNEPEGQLKAVINNSVSERKDINLEASTSFQRPKIPLQTLDANTLRPQSPEQLNIRAEVLSLAAPNTPENGNDHERLTLQSLQVDDEPVRASSAPPKTGISTKHYPEKLAAAKADAAKVLQLTNPNAQIQPRTSGPRSTLKGQNHGSRRDNITDRLVFVMEDGENFSEDNLRRGAKSPPRDGLEETGKPLRQHDQEKVDLQIHRRLGSLLDEPSPEKALLSPKSPSINTTKANLKSPTRPTASSRTRDNGSFDLDKLRGTTNNPNRGPSPTHPIRKRREPRQTGEKSAEDIPPSLSGQRPPPTSPNDHNPDPTDPHHEPLRARPLHRLGPDDFKINPDNAQGLDYAFTEVVRSHDQRRCLPGCTRPTCCGSALRRLVEIGGLPTPYTSGLWSSSPPEEDKDQTTQEHAETRVLKEYLGADHDRRVARMSEAERKEVLLDAKTREFADRHGRHRQAFERRTTPPGFWRADMPSTQELEGDREEARGLERRRVGEMYREAMREGGRWRFRDE